MDTVDTSEGDDRPSIYFDVERDKWIYRMSALWQCNRMLIGVRGGLTPRLPPDWLLKRFDEGRDSEPVLRDRLREGTFNWVGDRGPTLERFKVLTTDDSRSFHNNDSNAFPFVHLESVHDAQFTAEIPVSDNILVRGHMDDIVQLYQAAEDFPYDLGTRFVVEYKKFRKDYWKKWIRHGFDGFPEYQGQLSGYMDATGLPALFVVGQWDDDAENNIATVEAVVIDTPPKSIGKLKLRVLMIEKSAEVGQMPDVCDTKTYPCPLFAELHDEDEPADATVLDAEFESELAKYASASTIIKDEEKRKKEAGNRIKKLAEQAGLENGDAFIAGEFVGTWREQDVEGGVYERNAYTKRYPDFKVKGT